MTTKASGIEDWWNAFKGNPKREGQLPALQDTGVSFYLKLCNEIGLVEDLPDDPKDQKFHQKSMRAVARLVFTAITLPFFATVGAIYNTTMGLTKLMAKFYYQKSQPKLANKYADEVLNHLLFAVSDVVVPLFSSFFPIQYVFAGIYTIAPKRVQALYTRFADWLNKEADRIEDQFKLVDRKK